MSNTNNFQVQDLQVDDAVLQIRLQPNGVNQSVSNGFVVQDVLNNQVVEEANIIEIQDGGSVSIITGGLDVTVNEALNVAAIEYASL
jgi:hypothetical protein